MASFYPNEGGERRGGESDTRNTGAERENGETENRYCEEVRVHRVGAAVNSVELSCFLRRGEPAEWRARVCRTCRRRININAQGFSATRRRGGCSSSLVGRMYVYKYVSQRREPRSGSSRVLPYEGSRRWQTWTPRILHAKLPKGASGCVTAVFPPQKRG